MSNDLLDAHAQKVTEVKFKLEQLRKTIKETLDANPDVGLDDSAMDGEYKPEEFSTSVKYSDTIYVNRPFKAIRNDIYAAVFEVVGDLCVSLETSPDRFSMFDLEHMVDAANRISSFTKVIDAEDDQLKGVHNLTKLKRKTQEIITKTFNNARFNNEYSLEIPVADAELFNLFMHIEFEILGDPALIDTKCIELVDALKKRGVKVKDEKGLKDCLKDLLTYIEVMYAIFVLFSEPISRDAVNNTVQTPLTAFRMLQDYGLRAFVAALPKDGDEA